MLEQTVEVIAIHTQLKPVIRSQTLEEIGSYLFAFLQTRPSNDSTTFQGISQSLEGRRLDDAIFFFDIASNLFQGEALNLLSALVFINPVTSENLHVNHSAVVATRHAQ